MDERWFRRAIGFAWAMVGLPMLLAPPTSAWRGAVWVSAYLVFAGAAWWAQRGRPAPLPLLGVEALCVFAMVIVLCNGFEGALLVLVAMQLGRRRAPRLGLSWIAAQTALFAAGIAVHWSPRSAALLVPPYLGLQVMGYAVVRLWGRIEAAGRVAERLRIARDLHDAVGHHLTALSLNLEVAAHARDAVEPIRTAQSIAKLLLAEVRDVVSALAADERVDVAAALRRMAADIPAPRVHLRLPEALCVDAEGSEVMLRCAQEIITNAVRHAHAQNLWIEVDDGGAALELRGRDDGDGAAELRAGQGLTGMRARLERLGGTLSVQTRSGAGFLVVATLPRGHAA